MVIAAAAKEPEATEQGSNSNRHRNILMGSCESFLAKCKELWSHKDQRNKALWLILWAPQCNALLCFLTACFPVSYRARERNQGEYFLSF